MQLVQNDFPQARRFGNGTYALLAVAAVIMYLSIGMLTGMETSDPAQPNFGGFTMQNTSAVTYK